MWCSAISRRLGDIPRTTDNLLVVNRKNQFVGVAAADPGADFRPRRPSVREAMITDAEAIPRHSRTPTKWRASCSERLDLVTAPVVDDDGMLVGRITV